MIISGKTVQSSLFDFGPEEIEAVQLALPFLHRISRQELCPDEQAMVERAEQLSGQAIDRLEHEFDETADPLTERLADLRSVDSKRSLGQFFTPWSIVKPMVDWVCEQRPVQIIDAGCGTGRFAIAAAQSLPQVQVLAVDSDPMATLICRAHGQRLGLANLSVICDDYLHARLPLVPGRAAFIGNPPYVRHHRLPPQLKQWASARCADLGVPYSGLAGLHAYFFLATACHARSGDVGCFITSAEWLDVNYGVLVRKLLLERLGIRSLCVLDPKTAAFDDAMTSAAITCFEVGRSVDTVRISEVPCFTLAAGPADARNIPRSDLTGTWGGLLRRKTVPGAKPGMRLGDMVRVHRGIATGANKFFVMKRAEAQQRGLSSFARPVISAGRQILDSAGILDQVLSDCIIVLPRDLEELCGDVRTAALQFVAEGEKQGVHQRYLCAHRNPWWWLGSVRPPLVVVSYMARRPPAFATNPQNALILNIAHGLYPKTEASPRQLRTLVEILNACASQFSGEGRRYQGGLEKFEPREVEQLVLPSSPALRNFVSSFVIDSPEVVRHVLATTA